MTNNNAGASKLTRHLLSLIIVLFIIVSYWLLAIQTDLRLAVPFLIGVAAGLVGILSLILYLGEKNAIYWPPAMIMVVAALLRFLFLFLEPQLSDDIYRYLWDGLQSLNGHNPYSVAPADAQIQSKTLSLLLEDVNHPNLVTIYPPAAQLTFAAGSAIGGGVLGLKALLAALDLLTCAMLLRLLSVLGLPPWRAVLYAWHPLPILEIAASGHIDGVGILFLFFAFALLIHQPTARVSNGSLKSIPFRPILSFSPQSILCLTAGLAFAFSGMIKLVPLIFLPACLFLARGRSRALFITGTLVGGILLIAPFLPDLQNAVATFTVYVHRWEFSSSAYRSLRNITGSADTSRLILSACFLFAVLVLFLWLYLKKSPYGDHDSHRSPLIRVFQTCYGISMAYLFFTPTLHPWYALYLVCLLPFAAGPAGLLLTWSVFLAYRVLIPYKILGQWIEDDVTAFMVWVAPISALFLAVLFRRLFRGSNQGALRI